MKYNYAIIGCGAAGRVHAYHFSQKPIIECVAVADPNIENAQFFQDHFGFKSYYYDYKDMLAKENLDIISIATPPGLHLEQLTFALQQGSHVFCEKPLVINEEEVNAVMKSTRTSTKSIGIMLPRRYYNNTLAIKKVLDEGRLGRIENVSFDLKCNKSLAFYSSWRGKKSKSGGGILMGQAIHSIDQLIYLFGEPLKVKGVIRTNRENIEVEDEAEAIIYFPNNVKANLSATANSDITWKGITIIQGTNGQVILDSEKVILWDVEGIKPPVSEEKEIIPEEYKPQHYGPGHLKVIQDFLDGIVKGKFQAVTAIDSLKSVQLILEIYHSSKTNKLVNLSPII